MQIHQQLIKLKETLEQSMDLVRSEMWEEEFHTFETALGDLHSYLRRNGYFNCDSNQDSTSAVGSLKFK